MCDYSLMRVPNRIAIEGEELVAHRFQSGTTGFVSCSDFKLWRAERRSRSIWQWFRSCFFSAPHLAPVVCIPPGARLLLEPSTGWPNSPFYLGSSKIVTFIQLPAEANQHRDALWFGSGATLSLAMLGEGQRVRVLDLSPSEKIEPTNDTAQCVQAA